LWIKEKFRALLTIKDRPHHVALSFSIGVFIGISPLFGLHTVLGLLFSYIFRLNKFVTIMGVYITNPWTVIPIYTLGTWSGMKLLGVEGIIGDINWKALSLSNVVTELKILLWPFVLGSFFIGAVSAVVSYLLIYVLLKRRNA
jgi:uncharacterized protein (DUF2062 family)